MLEQPLSFPVIRGAQRRGTPFEAEGHSDEGPLPFPAEERSDEGPLPFPVIPRSAATRDPFRGRGASRSAARRGKGSLAALGMTDERTAPSPNRLPQQAGEEG